MNLSIFRIPVFLILVCGLLSTISFAQRPDPTPLPPRELSIYAFEQSILNEMNAVRANPKSYVPYVEEYKKRFKGNVVYFPNGAMIRTNEGITAVDEAIDFLKTASPVAPLKFVTGLAKTSNLQLSNLLDDPSLGHMSKDGTQLPQRLEKFGSVGSIYAENITYDAPTPLEIILAMIVDDGVKSRGHRKNLFGSDFRQVGIAYGKSKNTQNISVTVFADSFREITQAAGMKRI
jgi:uncharacterized protein YkwD